MRDEAARLLQLYDEQLRVHTHDREPAGITRERDGPIVRFRGSGPTGWVLYRDLGGLEGEAVDALIERQVRAYANRGMKFEWKYHGHDLPTDLPERLRAAGFIPEERETILIAPMERVPLDAEAPDGVVIRELDDPSDYERIRDLESAVWGEPDVAGWIESLAEEVAVDPEGTRVFLAVAGDIAVCAGWIRFPSGTDFGTLWGGSTRNEWRGRGIYRALVAARARVAAARGCRYLQVDASDDSRPILERLGFIPVATSTPYVWTPAIA